MENETNQYVQKVTETLRIGERSERTISNYVCAINRFLKYFHDNDIATLNETDIIGYIKKSYLVKDCAANTYNLNISALKYMYSICFNKEFNNKLLPHAKLTKKIPSTLDKEIFTRIFNEEKSLKHKCWLLLGYCSGLRVEEIAGIKIEDINPKEHKLKILGKRKKERFTVLPDIAIKYLRAYFKKYYYKVLYFQANEITKREGYLFEGISGNECINSKTITNYFTRIKKKYNLDEDISFHSLRHSFSTNFIKEGGDPFVLKSMLGHSSLNTTSIYVHMGRDFNNLKGVNYERI